MKLPEPIGPQVEKYFEELHGKRMAEKNRNLKVSKKFSLPLVEVEACHKIFHKKRGRRK